MDKKELIEFLISQQQEKLDLCQSAIEEMRSDLSGDTKSTAGDKHETARSMAQLEMEKLGKQHAEQSRLIESLHRMLQSPTSSSVIVGSLVKLDKSILLVGVGLGKVNFEENSIFCISPVAPIAQNLLGKKVGDSVQFPSYSDTILAID